MKEVKSKVVAVDSHRRQRKAVDDVTQVDRGAREMR